MLVKLKPWVNFTNILCAAFAPIFFCQKFTYTNCKHIKAAQSTIIEKKVTHQLNVDEIETFCQFHKRFSYEIFWRQNIVEKSARKMLIKLKPSFRFLFLFLLGLLLDLDLPLRQLLLTFWFLILKKWSSLVKRVENRNVQMYLFVPKALNARSLDFIWEHFCEPPNNIKVIFWFSLT